MIVPNHVHNDRPAKGAAEAPAAAFKLETSAWLNSEEAIRLADLRGKVVLVHAFQMLCPGCVSHALPQAMRVAEAFAGAPLVVLGLHTVFEHHEAMGLPSLRAFLHEYRIRFPVGVDQEGPPGDPIPRTMRKYSMRGTPTTLVIDSIGRLRAHIFGQHDDLRLGAVIGRLLGEKASEVGAVPLELRDKSIVGGVCDDEACAS